MLPWISINIFIIKFTMMWTTFNSLLIKLYNHTMNLSSWRFSCHSIAIITLSPRELLFFFSTILITNGLKKNLQMRIYTCNLLKPQNICKIAIWPQIVPFKNEHMKVLPAPKASRCKWKAPRESSHMNDYLYPIIPVIVLGKVLLKSLSLLTLKNFIKTFHISINIKRFH